MAAHEDSFRCLRRESERDPAFHSSQCTSYRRQDIFSRVTFLPHFGSLEGSLGHFSLGALTIYYDCW